MRLTPYRRAMLIVNKALEFAEKGGMAPEDCGAIYQALDCCLIASARDGNVEQIMQSLIDEISLVIKSDDWDFRKVQECES